VLREAERIRFGTQVAELGNPHYSSHRSPRKSGCRRPGGRTPFVLPGPGLTLSRSRCEPAPPSTSTGITRCRIPTTGIACSAQIPASIRTLYRIQLRIHLLYPLLVFMIIRRCHQYTHSRLQFGLHRVKALVPVSIQITNHILQCPVTFLIYPWSHIRLHMHNPNISTRMAVTLLHLIPPHTLSMQLS